MIGIRLADGTFFSICSDGPEKKRVVLSPANRNQKKAKIDLFRYDDAESQDGYHIGSLFLDALGTAGDDNSEIELFIDTDGSRIRAVATDLRGGGRSELETALPGIAPKEEPAPDVAEPEPVRVRGIRSLQVMMVVLLLMMAFITGCMLYSMLSVPNERCIPEFAEPDLPPPPPLPAPEPAPAPAPMPEPAPVSEPPASVPASPAALPQEYIRYKVKYGDTLWSIARDFCRDPYMYRRIARENNLESPDRLISGTTLIIPVDRH